MAVPDAISDEERARRQTAVNFAEANVRLEGFLVSAADKRHAQRYVNGEITLTEFVDPTRLPMG